MDTELDERKRKILKAIIQTYLETGEPVGSRTISKYTDLNLSSATIRNEMSDLEELGYILQPHTSAGRIPSDNGYRLYVDELMREKEQEVADIKNTSGRDAGSVTAGLFVGEFVKEDTPWVHLDIAATAYRNKKSGYLPKNATGIHVKTLNNLLDPTDC